MNCGSVPRATEGLEFVPGHKGGRILGPDGEIHYLNQTAAGVWLLSDGSRNVEAIARHLAEMFRLKAPPIEDVLQALETLSDKGLIYDKG